LLDGRETLMCVGHRAADTQTNRQVVGPRVTVHTWRALASSQSVSQFPGCWPDIDQHTPHAHTDRHNGPPSALSSHVLRARQATTLLVLASCDCSLH